MPEAWNRFVPEPAPDATDLEAMVRYLHAEFERLSNFTQAIAEGQKEVVFHPPERLVEGMERFADGGSWNPWGGRGIYYYDSSWRQLLALPAATALAVPLGGTGHTSWNQGDVLYASGVTTLAGLPKTVTPSFLDNEAASNNPRWTAKAALSKTDDTNVTLSLGGSPLTALLAATSLTLGWTGTLAASRLNSNVVQAVANDTNVTGAIASQTLTLGWTGTLAAARLNANVVQAVVNDTNVTGAIATQTLTLGFTGTLAAARLNANVVQSVVNDTNVTGSISSQAMTLGWTGQLGVSRGGTGLSSLTLNRVPYGNGTSAFQSLAGFNFDGSLLTAPAYAAGSLPASAGAVRLGDGEKVSWKTTGVDYVGLRVSGGVLDASGGTVFPSDVSLRTTSSILSSSGSAWTFTGSLTVGGTMNAGSYLNNLSAFAATTSAQLAGVISDETGSGALVFATSPTLVTPTLGAATATTINSTVIPTAVTLTKTTDKLSVFAATTSAELAGVLSDETGTGSFVLATSPTLVTPTLGAATATTINSTAIPTAATLTKTTDKLSVFAATTSAELAGVISDETGSGALVFATSPSLVTPALGVATATSINATVIPSSKTLVVTTDTLAVHAATTSLELAGVISDETGSGALVFGTLPTFTTAIKIGASPASAGDMRLQDNGKIAWPSGANYVAMRVSTGTFDLSGGTVFVTDYIFQNASGAIVRSSGANLSLTGGLTFASLGGGGGAVSVGAADSGGTGFKYLRVPN